MKPIFSPVCSLCLVTSVFVYQAPTSAQGICYFVNAEGQTINLDDLCAGDGSTTPTSATATLESEVDAVTEADPINPRVTTTTITITGNSINRLDGDASTAPDTNSDPEAVEASGESPTTFTSGPGQPINGGAVMTNSDPRLINSQPAPTETAPSGMTTSPEVPAP